jgi:glycosyltransferase involved in cell wall biosynthesis
MKGFTLITESHDDPMTSRTKYRPLFIRKIILGNSDLIIAHSKYCKLVLEKLGFKNSIYIPLGPYIETPKIINKNKAKKKLKINKKNHVILFFGIITPDKGIEILIKSIPSIKKEVKDIKILLVGPVRDNWKYYEKIIKEFKVDNDIVRIPRYVPLKKAYLFFSASDVVVLTHKEITNSSIPFVAYNYKRPIVASNVGGFKEIIKNNETGLLFQNENISELSKKIIFILKHDKLAKKWGENGYKLMIKGKYSWANIEKKYRNLFIKISN